MSRIDDLLAELCPEGVVFNPLGQLVRIRNGKDHKSLGVGDIPAYGTGGVMRYVDTAAYDRPSVLIPRKGSLDKLYYVDEPFWTVDTIFYTEIGPRLEPKFLYHFLAKLRLETLNGAGGVPSLTQSVLNALRIPVPPLEVQREIVRILDSLSALETELAVELEKELGARRTQYVHYRDSLLTAGEDWEWSPMGEVGEFVRGRRFTKGDVVDAGIPSIHYGEIYTHYGVGATVTLSQVREALAPQLRYAQSGDVVIAGVGETVEDVGKAVAWLGAGPVAIHDDCFAFRHSLNPKFVSYYLQSAPFHEQKYKHVSRAKVKRLSSSGLGQITIPIPAMVEQERIVEILDGYEPLMHELSVEISAEVAARRKQYEHYRDRLLTFEEAPA